MNRQQRRRRQRYITGTQANTLTLLEEKFKSMKLSLFEWDNLPDGLNSEILEEMIYEHGRLVGYNDPDFGPVILPFSESGGRNIYNKPLAYQIHFKNLGSHRIIDSSEGIILKNDSLGTKAVNYVEQYTKDLLEVKYSISKRLYGDRIPFIVVTNTDNELSLRALFSDNLAETTGRDFEPLVLVDKGPNARLDGETKVLDLPAGTTELTDLYQMMKNYESELYEYLGIDNSQISKRERVLTDELDSQKEKINITKQIMLEQRQLFAEKFNEKFGTTITVKLRETVDYEEIEMEGYNESMDNDDIRPGIER